MVSPSIKSLYDSLDPWLETHSPETFKALAAPVSAADLSALDNTLVLPDALREALRCHDGRASFDGYQLLSAERMRGRYVGEMENAERPSFSSDGTCRPVMWSKGWIPFAEDGGLNYLCIDLDPGPKGVSGQVIRWERASWGADAAEWKSFGEWLAVIVAACLSGGVDIEYGSIFRK